MIMTPQEKAAAYDMAIERTRQMIEDYKNRGLDNYYACAKESLEKIFPELRESDDERIKEKIKATIHLFFGEPLKEEAKEMITWLEKHEQKHIPWYDLEKSKEAGYTIVPNEEYERIIKIAEWSEEDDSKLKEVLYYIEYINRANVTFQQKNLTHLINWLKSLRP